MNDEQFQQRKERAVTEPLVIAQTDEGFRVYSASNPGTIYVVSGNPEAPACTCPDFGYRRHEPRFRCKHILAVLNQLESLGRGEETDPVAAEERRAIQSEGHLPERKRTPAKGNGTPQMVLKRQSRLPDMPASP